MKTVNLVQGTEEWLEFRANHYPASEAPAAMGHGLYDPKTPEDLALVRLGLKKKKISEYQQKIFDEGHQHEEAARPIVEKMIVGEPLSNVTGYIETPELAMNLSASFDGINFDNTVIFEHKKWNEKLAEAIRNKDLPPEYYWQLEQQLLVSGAQKVIFVTSDAFVLDESIMSRDKFDFVSDELIRPDGSKYVCVANYMEWMEYTPVPGRAEQLIKGWQNYESILSEILVENELWEETANKYVPLAEKQQDLKAELKELENQMKPLKSAFISYAKKTGCQKIVGANIEVKSSIRKGKLMEKAILEQLNDLRNQLGMEPLKDLDDFRAEETVSWRVSVLDTKITPEEAKDLKKETHIPPSKTQAMANNAFNINLIDGTYAF